MVSDETAKTAYIKYLWFHLPVVTYWFTLSFCFLCCPVPLSPPWFDIHLCLFWHLMNVSFIFQSQVHSEFSSRATHVRCNISYSKCLPQKRFIHGGTPPKGITSTLVQWICSVNLDEDYFKTLKFSSSMNWKPAYFILSFFMYLPKINF